MRTIHVRRFLVSSAVLVGLLIGCGSTENSGGSLPEEAGVDAGGAPLDGATTDAAALDAAANADGDAALNDGGPLAPVLAKVGVPGKILLRGMVLTPDTAFAGEVLVEDDLITCVAASCAASAGAATASIVETNGVILPGMIDAHNHVQFDIMDETDWTPLTVSTNHTQWVNEARYSAMVDVKQYLGGEGASPVDLKCEIYKYGSLKGLVAGTTSLVGAPTFANSKCYGTLARPIDQNTNGLGVDKVSIATLFPDTPAADGICNSFADTSTDAYLVHVAEGTDQTALNEFNKLITVSTVDGCLLNPKTTIVNGIALGAAELTIMATNGMGLVWSPRSNIFLYGGGVDLTKTANIPLAVTKGINISIGADWSIGGSQSLLDELRYADNVDNTTFGNVLSPKMLVQMATSNAAKNLGLSTKIGSLAVGLKADIMVVSGNAALPYDAVLAAHARVMVNGVPLVGAPALKAIAPSTPACETLDVCGVSKFICVAAPGGTVANKLGQTFAEIKSALAQGLTDYDALNLSAYKFAPLTPVVRCP